MVDKISERQLDEIVQRVLADLKAAPRQGASGQLRFPEADGVPGGRDGIFDDIDTAVAAARRAFTQLQSSSLDLRRRIVAAIRQQGRQHAKELAEMACAETGLGRVDSKISKNLLVSDRTPGVEILEPIAESGDSGLTLTERAPFGVVASITPLTNPNATIVNNAISTIAAGNAVVFNPHPRGRQGSNYTIQLLNRAIRAAGGPASLLTAIEEPTVESAQQLMRHPDVNLLVVTGGPGVAKFAMSTGKRAVCAGPGNPPVVVDESADIEKAGRDIVAGCSFDNNLACTDEKEIFVVAQVADELKAAICRAGAHEVSGEQIRRLEKLIFAEMGEPWEAGAINMDCVGQDAEHILGEIGVRVGSEIRVVLLEVEAEHPLVWTEQMMPVLPLVRVQSADEAIDLAKRAEHGFHHTAIMHSRNLHNLSRMAREMNTSVFVKNGPSFAGIGYGGEGYTSFSIGTLTGEGLTTARTFSWERRCVLVDHFRIV